MHAIWMEMEGDEEVAVVIHVSCAWDAVRDKLYALDERNQTRETWIGWEPMDGVSPYTIRAYN